MKLSLAQVAGFLQAKGTHSTLMPSLSAIPSTLAPFSRVSCFLPSAESVWTATILSRPRWPRVRSLPLSLANNFVASPISHACWPLTTR